MLLYHPYPFILVEFSRINFNSSRNAKLSENCRHMTAATKLDYGLRKTNTFGCEYVAGRKGYIWTLTMYTHFLLIINFSTIMRDRKHRAITQTIHTNLISWVFSVMQAMFSSNLIQTHNRVVFE